MCRSDSPNAEEEVPFYNARAMGKSARKVHNSLFLRHIETQTMHFQHFFRLAVESASFYEHLYILLGAIHLTITQNTAIAFNPLLSLNMAMTPPPSTYLYGTSSYWMDAPLRYNKATLILHIFIEQTSVEAWNGIGKTFRNQSEKYHVPIFCGTGEEVISAFDSCCGILPKKQYYGFSITVITSPPIYECHFMIVFALVSSIIFVGYSMTFFRLQAEKCNSAIAKD